MNRSKAILRVFVVALPIATVAVATSAPREADAQYVAPPPPPDAYIATTAPEYYEGHPVYWYNGSWFYRDGRGAWSYYRNEPAYLRDRRAHVDPRRYHYHR